MILKPPPPPLPQDKPPPPSNTPNSSHNPRPPFPSRGPQTPLFPHAGHKVVSRETKYPIKIPLLPLTRLFTGFSPFVPALMRGVFSPPGNEEAGRGMERSVSVILEGEEAELVFIRLQEITQAIAREGHADGWVVVYAINDRESFKAASTVLGRVWSLGHVTQRAVILVANKTDLQRTRVVTTSEGRTLAMTYECKFIEVSAGIDHNVDELLNKVLSSENQEAPGSGSEGSPTATQQRMRHKNSFRVKGILNKLLNKDRKTKSCENLHVL
ncbi:hypothetical protein C7M84_004297 [Penaeus vannamei]|uniref:Uncharacterized protein n=1 Tax=Penaeus vannamei TaxID=6689 RepID=A0A3R7QPN6_PENVA|nr:hypothetical protein C7M84_004297 [Penaeus vannamei]